MAKQITSINMDLNFYELECVNQHNIGICSDTFAAKYIYEKCLPRFEIFT